MKGFTRFAAALSVVACNSDNSMLPPTGSQALAVLGQGVVTDRYTAEIWVRGNVAYTTTWGSRQAPGNAVNIWDVSGDVPTLVNTVIVPNAATLGDVQTSDDGQLLIVATEYSPDGSIMIYSLADPVHPQLISRYATALTSPGVHTAEVQRVNGSSARSYRSIREVAVRLVWLSSICPIQPRRRRSSPR